MPITFKSAAERAILNINAFGDTDIFPFPAELLALKENSQEAVKLLQNIHKNFDQFLVENPPYFYSEFIPNGYTGFRWATQIDTLWNAYFLSLVIMLGDGIEPARIERESNFIHSYRYQNNDSPELWDKNYGWKSFFDRSQEIANKYEYIVICDLSEFYRRINHHRLENAILHISSGDIAKRLIRFLTIFSNNASYGLPIGGPAARLLSELVLNQTDHLLRSNRIEFCRFADDFVIGASSIQDAYSHLIFISEKLQQNQGLLLQKSKTRILTSHEYKNSKPLAQFDDDDVEDNEIKDKKSQLFQLTLHYDPYSQSAEEDYNDLKSSVKNLHILDIINHEIRKSRIHVPTINRIVKALQHAPSNVKSDALLTMFENIELFYPCLSSILIIADQIHEDINVNVREKIESIICDKIELDDYIFKNPTFIAFAIRYLGNCTSVRSNTNIFSSYNHQSEIVKLSVITSLTKRKSWMELSNIRHNFSTMSPILRRATFISSYALKDEGSHWRNKATKSPFDAFICTWMAQRQGSLEGIA